MQKGKSEKSSYEYIFSNENGGGNLILWNRSSHTVAGQAAGRNVLYADLSLEFLAEKDFQSTPKAKAANTQNQSQPISDKGTRKNNFPPTTPRIDTLPPRIEPQRPVEKVMSLDSVLQDLKSASTADMDSLLKFLQSASPVDEHRPAVIAATKPLLNDVKVGNVAFAVFLSWSDKNQIPDFIEFLHVEPKSQRGKEAMKFLSSVGDARAAEPLAACLTDLHTTREAKSALASLGEIAKTAVLPYYHHPDRRVKDTARELLRGYKATEEEMFSETLKALQNGSLGSRQSAIFDITSAQLNPQQQQAVCLALQPLVNDAERSISEGARKAMTALATNTNADFLLGLIDSNDDRTSQFAVDLLVKLKEEKVAKPLAMQLGDPKKTHAAGRALIALGAVAEPAVLPYLKNNELNTRKRAAEVLGVIGSKASLPELEKIARNKNQDNFFARVAAERAVAAIKSRTTN
jgi:HEAT repeat protein